ncbi:MAG: hypothetical protein Q9221_003019 [Calogaya cf. arnoldii]
MAPTIAWNPADADAESHRSWTRNHDDEFQLNLLRPWSITSHPSVRSRSSTITDTQYASASALDPDDASSKGLLGSGTWRRFGRRSRDASDDLDNPGAEFAYGGPGWWKHQMLSDRSFRTMAATTTVLAFVMSIICIVYLKDLSRRPNKNSTSVGGKAPTGSRPDGSEYRFAGELEDWQYNTVAVVYTEGCAQYRETTTIQDMRNMEVNTDFSGDTPTLFSIGDCGYKRNVTCSMNPHKKGKDRDSDGARTEKCRLSVRMSAALILAGCLIVKAVYMVTIVLRGRKKIKSKCLTFGDVIAASVLDPSLQIKNECMVNAFDGHRHLIQHTCHPKHCRPGVEPSPTGDSIGHCQKCKKFNEINYAGDLLHPNIAIKYKKSLIANLGGNAVSQMALLSLTSVAMFGISVMLALFVASAARMFQEACRYDNHGLGEEICKKGQSHFLKYRFGYFGGFDTAASLGSLGMNSVNSEVTAFAISNGAQLLYSLIYLLLIYNFTLISMERDWGRLERVRDRLRCTLVEGEGFKQSYLLQLPKRLLYPMMVFSSLMHWLLGQSISTKETIWADYTDPSNPVEFSEYNVVYGAYAVWLSTILMLAQTGICWWAFTYSREGFMPQMYGSIRACCAATTQLTIFPKAGIQWGDLGEGEKFRHAGFSSDEVKEIIPAELYCGLGSEKDDIEKIKNLGQEHDGMKRRIFITDPGGSE